MMIEAIVGPYRGRRLTVSDANATAAINDHWARDPYAEELAHDPLTDAEREAALAAANTWARAQWDAAESGQPPPEPAPVGTRAMHAEGGGEYKTRAAKK